MSFAAVQRTRRIETVPPLLVAGIACVFGNDNIMGPWTELAAETEEDWDAFTLHLGSKVGRVAWNYSLFEIGIGSVGNEVVLLPTYPCSTVVSGAVEDAFPLYIAKGSRVVFRGRCEEISGIQSLQVKLFGHVRNAFAPTGYTECVALNVSASRAYLGTKVNGPTDVIGNYGSWAQITAATPWTPSSVRFVVGSNIDANLSNGNSFGYTIRLAVGLQGEEVVIANHFGQVGTQRSQFRQLAMHESLQLPANARLSAQCAADSIGATGRSCMYGLYFFR